MKKNMSAVDRGIRILVAVAVIALYNGNIISGTTAVVLVTISIISIVTGIYNFCPVYRLFGISTYKTQKQ